VVVVVLVVVVVGATVVVGARVVLVVVVVVGAAVMLVAVVVVVVVVAAIVVATVSLSPPQPGITTARSANARASPAARCNRPFDVAEFSGFMVLSPQGFSRSLSAGVIDRTA
jgi:hypothetical protein